MLIQVADIPPEGLRIEGTADFPEPFQDPTWALDELALIVEKDGDTVFVRGDLSARVPLTCGRCLEGYTVTVHPAVDARFVPLPATRGHRALDDDGGTEVASHGIDRDLHGADLMARPGLAGKNYSPSTEMTSRPL